jgi:hypothetical protein
LQYKNSAVNSKCKIWFLWLVFTDDYESIFSLNFAPLLFRFLSYLSIKKHLKMINFFPVLTYKCILILQLSGGINPVYFWICIVNEESTMMAMQSQICNIKCCLINTLDMNFSIEIVNGLLDNRYPHCDT